MFPYGQGIYLCFWMCMCVRENGFWMSSEYACARVSARTTNAVSELVMQLHWKHHIASLRRTRGAAVAAWLRLAAHDDVRGCCYNLACSKRLHSSSRPLCGASLSLESLDASSDFPGHPLRTMTISKLGITRTYMNKVLHICIERTGLHVCVLSIGPNCSVRISRAAWHK